MTWALDWTAKRRSKWHKRSSSERPSGSGSEPPGVDREYVTRLITSTFPGDRNRSIRKFLNAEIDALLADEGMKR